MKRFEHGDHECSVVCMDIDEALRSNLLKRLDGSFPAFVVGRAAYAFCSKCTHFAWSTSEDMLSSPDPVDPLEDNDVTLEKMAIFGFKEGASESCAVQKDTEFIREVMTS